MNLEEILKHQPVSSEHDPLLVPSAAAKRLGVCPETVWRWIKKGAIDFEEVGPFRKKRIRESTVAALMKRGTSAA